MNDWLIDTNVISETIKPKPDPHVMSWIAAQPRLIIAAVTAYELALGIELTAAGKRRRALEAWFAALLSEETIVVPFDQHSATEAAAVEAGARRRGRGVERRDLFILATARAHQYGVATRNVDHFRGFGVGAYNPFTDEHAL